MKKWEKDSIKLWNSAVRLSVTCPYCQHKNTMPVYQDKKICYWCGNKVNNNTKEYFKYKLRKVRNEKKD